MIGDKVDTKSVELRKLTFEELYAEISWNWEQKAARLQERRWRMLEQKMKNNGLREEKQLYIRLSPSKFLLI